MTASKRIFVAGLTLAATREAVSTPAEFVDMASPGASVRVTLLDAAGEAADPPGAGAHVPYQPVVRALGGARAAVVLYDITRKATFDIAVSHVRLPTRPTALQGPLTCHPRGERGLTSASVSPASHCLPGPLLSAPNPAAASHGPSRRAVGVSHPGRNPPGP